MLLEPFIKRYMPASPVFLDIPGKIRTFEIFGKGDPKHSGNSADNIHIAREIRIKFNSIKEYGYYQGKSVIIIR